MKRLTALFLVLCLLTAPVFAVGTFSDIQNHWAKDYIEDLAERGIVSGFEDGTVLPEKNITVAEALTLLGGIFTVDSSAAGFIDEEYGDYLDELLPSGFGWLKGRAGICLAGGVITRDELNSLAQSNKLGSPIAKEYLCVLFVRAMQLEDEARSLASVSLSFDDFEDINSSYRPYIYILVSEGIIKGDNNNNFTPKLAVTRAVAFTMLSRTLGYLEDNGGMPVLSFEEPEEEYSRTEGVLTSIKGYSITLTSLNGEAADYHYTSATAVYVDGVRLPLSESCLGCTAYIISDSAGAITELGVDRSQKWVQGAINSAQDYGDSRAIFIKDLATGSGYKYDVSMSASLKYEGLAVQFKALKSGSFISAKISNGLLAEIHTYNGDYTVTGTVAGITYGTQTVLTVLTSEGVRRVSVITASPPVIHRALNRVRLNDIRLGDHVTVTVNNCQPSVIETTALAPSVTGEITGINLTLDGFFISVRDSAGITQTFDLASNVGITRGGAEVSASDLEVGDEVKIAIFEGVVTEIIVTSPSVLSGVLQGTVLALDISRRELTLLTEDSALIYVSVPDTAPVLDKKGGSVSLSSVAIGQSVAIKGARTGSGSFSATEVNML
ncbi:MAG: S-layer homology domain-containing protein [Oscillospiraceae bacterium]|jgi:hypothetical protein